MLFFFFPHFFHCSLLRVCGSWEDLLGCFSAQAACCGRDVRHMMRRTGERERERKKSLSKHMQCFCVRVQACVIRLVVEWK